MGALEACAAEAVVRAELGADPAVGADAEKYDSVDGLEEVVEAGVEGKGVEGGDESRT